MPGSRSSSRGGRCGSRSTRAHRSPRTSQAPSQSPQRRRTSKGRAPRRPRLRAVPRGRASGGGTGRAGRVERGASRPRSVGAGHPLRARGTCVSRCHTARLLPGSAWGISTQSLPPPAAGPPCRGAPRDKLGDRNRRAARRPRAPSSVSSALPGGATAAHRVLGTLSPDYRVLVLAGGGVLPPSPV